MAVIKSNVAATGNPVAFSMADIEQQARGIIARARGQVSQLLAEAQREAEDLRTKAHADGLAAGFEQGMARGLEEGAKLGHARALDDNHSQLSACIASLTEAAIQVDARRRELDSAALRDVIGLSVKIADRITKREGKYDPDVLFRNVSECLGLVVGAHDLRIAVHPAQKATLADAMPRLKLEFPELQHVEITEDDATAPGGCLVYTRQGLIDADLNTQLDRIACELIPESPGDESMSAMS